MVKTVTITIDKVDINDWGSTAPVFRQFISEVNPKHIIEVGTWKGASAIHMASIVKELNLPCKISCVDTWLGASEFYLEPIPPRDLMFVEGYPTVYYQFLYNIEETGHKDIITPYTMTSNIAYEIFSKRGITADLIYIDGSHEYEDVADDIRHYYELLNPGGTMFGDDYTPAWAGVRRAYNEFTELHGLPRDIRLSNYWVVKK